MIAAMILRMTMLRYAATSRTHKASQMVRSDSSALALIQSFWDNYSYNCATGTCYSSVICGNNVPGYTCLPASGAPPGVCGCTCTPTSSADPTVRTVAISSSVCQLQITSANLQ